MTRYHYTVEDELDMRVQTALASRSIVWQAYTAVVEVGR